MMNASGDRLLELKILGQTYRVRVQGSEERAEKVRSLVEQTVDDVQKRAPLSDPAMVAVLAALNLGDRLLMLEENQKGLAMEIKDGSSDVAKVLDDALI
ncbi:MAG: cell division protein ZapA [Acidobacteriota bacterium]